jgi:hypothetical protein
MYLIGLPAWKLLASWGVPVMARVNVHFDDESQSLWADSPDLDGLVVAGNSLEEIQSEARLAARELIQLAVHSSKAQAHTELRVRGAALNFA